MRRLAKLTKNTFSFIHVFKRILEFLQAQKCKTNGRIFEKYSVTSQKQSSVDVSGLYYRYLSSNLKSPVFVGLGLYYQGTFSSKFKNPVFVRFGFRLYYLVTFSSKFKISGFVGLKLVTFVILKTIE